MAQAIRAASLVISAAILLGFAMFTSDELGAGSENQARAVDGRQAVAGQQRIDQIAPAATVERERERRHSAPREYIDDVNDLVLGPFAGVTGSDSPWASRGVAALIGLLLFGLGGSVLANAVPKPSNATTDWRERTG